MDRIDPARLECLDDNAIAEAPIAARDFAQRPRPTLTRPRRESWDSRKLLDGRKQVSIRHNGEIYTLRQTQAGKLLLTK